MYANHCQRYRDEIDVFLDPSGCQIFRSYPLFKILKRKFHSSFAEKLEYLEIARAISRTILSKRNVKITNISGCKMRASKFYTLFKLLSSNIQIARRLGISKGVRNMFCNMLARFSVLIMRSTDR